MCGRPILQQTFSHEELPKSFFITNWCTRELF